MPFARDTSLEAARVYFAVWRRLGVTGRARQLLELNDSVRNLAAAGIRWQHPEYTEDQVQRAVVRRLLGEPYFRTTEARKADGDRMNQEAFIARVTSHLEASGITYMVAGSVASALLGEPRSTPDVDIVMDPTADQLQRLVQALGSDYYISPEAAQEALQHRSMFNLIDFANGWKADLIFRKDRPFSREEFSRRRAVPYGGGQLWIASPEDIILSKLEWAKITPSERQLRDALGVAVTQWPQLDQGYLRHWARELEVEGSLEQVLREAEELQPRE
jgi:hypothetical protein